MKKKIHIIAHTHWDYEWYFTSKESFIQLCYHIDEVLEALETGIIDYYMLDGQMSIVEDYLHIHPENQERIKLLVQEGKLKIGPWYTQSDQMIIRGESLVDRKSTRLNSSHVPYTTLFRSLCYHIDEVLEALETGIIDYYMLDGQMSIVEDYLHIHPENQERIKLLVQEGKLKIGPWYTQSDQMIIRGESLVRNLQIGIELGDRLGGADRLGYIPDAF